MPRISRKKTLDELRSEAIAEFERRGYDVRGKTPAQIRQMLRARRPKRKSIENQQLNRWLFRTTSYNNQNADSMCRDKKGSRIFLKDGGPKRKDYRPGSR